MKFTTLTARFPGTCKRCNRPIAVGDIIRYGGKGQTYHLAAICSSDAVQQQPVQQASSIRNDTIPVMTPALAADIRSLFETLIAKPVQLTDPLGELEPSDRPVPDPQPETFTFTTIAGATVKTVPQPASIDSDLF